MQVIICRDAEEVGRVAAGLVVKELVKSPEPVLGVATGSSPLATYADLVRRAAEGQFDPQQLEVFALDEYVGLPTTSEQSYARTIQTTVTEPLNLDPERVHVPNGMADDPNAAGEAYEMAIDEAGGVDVQILGIGTNGHIGFNEPGASFSSRTRLETLTQGTRADNQRFFGSLDEVPLHCVTQGLGTIMDAAALVLVATGESKAEAIAACVEGPVTSQWPASIMQFHPTAFVVIDEAAASKLARADHYRHVWANLPESMRPLP